MTEHLYAIGDIHGCAQLLERALAWIDNNAGGSPTHIVFTGDCIDRGPDSKAVLEKRPLIAVEQPESRAVDKDNVVQDDILIRLLHPFIK